MTPCLTRAGVTTDIQSGPRVEKMWHIDSRNKTFKNVNPSVCLTQTFFQGEMFIS